MRDTSAEAYAQIKAEGLLSRQRFNVYSALYRHGPCSASELVSKLKDADAPWVPEDDSRPTVARRLSELRDRGVAREVDERPCRVTGRNVIVWDVTSLVPAGVDTRSSVFPKADKLAALKVLLRIYPTLSDEDKVVISVLGRWLRSRV